MDKTINQQADPETIIEHKINPPSLYKVILHNDDVTTMDFVVNILINVFKKSEGEATTIMLSVHEEGIGVCGVYPKEIAEFRTQKTLAMAKRAGYPLFCNMEKE